MSIDKIQKAFQILGVSYEPDIEKGSKGEGSRGGKVIGHTKSGKPIYDHFDHKSHKDFTKKDHNDAAKLHMKKFREALKDAKKEAKEELHGFDPYGRDDVSHHSSQEDLHSEAAGKD
jgi:hypothetical protein